jgi:hypothetical protein
MLQRTLDETHLAGSALIIVTADHGGNGLLHPPEDPLSQYIPWIAVGPTVRKNFDLSQVAGLTVNTMGTFATVCAVMGIVVPHPVDAQPVLDIFDGRKARTREH